jgi:hypothetical protein
MQRLAFVFLILAGGCSGIDNFSAFKFEAIDMMPPGPAAFGEACGASGCMQYGTRAVSCVTTTTTGSQTFPGGICTRGCVLATAGACSDFPGTAVCTVVDANTFCLEGCNAAMPTPCRTGYSCCSGGHLATADGVCAPTDSHVCH